MKKMNPAAGANRSEVGVAAAWSPHSDLTPLRTLLKRGERYLSHTTFDGFEFEAPPTERWRGRTVTVEVLAILGGRWIDEGTWTYNFYDRPVGPRGWGWVIEGPAEANSSS